MDKFQNKYRISSARLQNWDYGWNAAYFITICTANRECYFGNIVHGKMELTEIGELANAFLLEIPQRYQYAMIDVFIIMPNHVHAIIIIDKMDVKRVDADANAFHCRNAINRVSTMKTKTESSRHQPKKRGGITGNKNPMLHNNISRILNWYKGRITFESRKIDKNFAWQSRFYDHIIRDYASHERIRNYIINNPKNWHKDVLNTK